MSVANFCRRLICLYFAVASVMLGAAEPEHLKTKDINVVMKQIFAQHVDKKEMTASILKNSFKVYIDQFDPDRLYLYQQEVQPFLQPSDAAVTRYLEQYKQGQFPEYTDLNNVIQKAILRARQMRMALERDHKASLFQTNEKHATNGNDDWRDPDLKRPFATNEGELNTRIKDSMQQFMANARKRYGNDNVANRQDQLLNIFESQAKQHENQYLFLTENGQPMNEVEKENAFSMHVLKALSNSLDAHTSILNASEANDMRVRLEKEVQGIGITLQPRKDGSLVVSEMLEGGPAAKSGLIQINDRLIEIDGTKVANKSPAEIMELIRGKVGTKATLVLERTVDENNAKVNKTIRVELVRQEIAVNDDRVQVSFEKYGTGIIGKIKLDSFYQSENGVSSESDMRAAIKELDKQGNLRGLILDFRENSGGFLSQAVKVAGLFISNGIVVISKYFNGEEHFYRDMEGKMAYDGPLIILTSKATASAAEIVAQALQDYGVALIVGDEHTYGKGTIQSQTITENKASTYFKVTVGKYYTVSGKTPQIQGVKADIVAPSQFTHENIGEEYLDYPLKEDTIPPEYNDTLEDIAPNLKSWYMHYYTPTIQRKIDKWRNMLPTLKQNSAARINNNKDYQLYINGPSSEVEIAAWKKQLRNSEDDLQMAEAINIVKDMVVLETKTHLHDNNSQTADGATMQYAPK